MFLDSVWGSESMDIVDPYSHLVQEKPAEAEKPAEPEEPQEQEKDAEPLSGPKVQAGGRREGGVRAGEGGARAGEIGEIGQDRGGREGAWAGPRVCLRR